MANKTKNFGLTKPLDTDFYDVSVMNENMDIIDEELKNKLDIKGGKLTGSLTIDDSDGIGLVKRRIVNDVPYKALFNLRRLSSEPCPTIELTDDDDNEIRKIVLSPIATGGPYVKENNTQYYFYGTHNKPTKSDVGLNNVPNVATNDQTPTYTEASTLTGLTSGEKLSVAFGKIKKAITDLISHLSNKSNPHSVTAEQVGALPKEGGTLTGNMSLQKDSGNISLNFVHDNLPTKGIVEFQPISGKGTLALRNYASANEQCNLQLNSPASELAKILRLTVNGSNSYNIFGEHNKELLTNYLLSLAGGTLTGDLVIQKDAENIYSTVKLDNSTTDNRAIFQYNPKTKNVLIRNHKSDAEQVYLQLCGYDTDTKELFNIHHYKDGTSKKYSIYGEHNEPNKRGSISSTNSTSFSIAFDKAPKMIFFNYYGVQGMAGYYGDGFGFLIKQNDTYVGAESPLDGRSHDETNVTLKFLRGSYSNGILTVTKSTLNNHSGTTIYYNAVM